MEEIRRRLELDNTGVKQQTIKKLQEQIEKQIADGIINETTTQSIELRLLWEKTGDPDLLVSTTVCQALVELVSNGKADFNFVLKGLLSAVPSARCLVGPVKSLCDLLVLQMIVLQNAGKTYCNPYSIRQPPHPFITVLTSRPESWPLLQQQVQRLINWPSEIVRHNAYKLLAPYLKFVLLEPVQSPQFTQCRLALLPACIQSATATQNDHIVCETLQFFLDILPCLQKKTVSSVGETTHFLMTLTSFMTSQEEKFKGAAQRETAKRLIMQMISLSLMVTREGLTDPVIFIDMIEDLSKVYPETINDSAFLVATVEMLVEGPPYCRLKLLKLVHRHLCKTQKKPATDFNVNALLFFPLLNLMASSAPFCENAEIVQRLTAAILIELETASVTKPQDLAGDEIQQESFKISHSPCNSEYIVSLYELLWRSGPDEVSAYLHQLNTSIAQLGITKQIVPLVTAVFCTHTDSHKILATSLQLFETIAIKLPSQSLCLLPVLLYKMNKVTSPQMKLDILNVLPKLATHKVSMGPILRTLQLIGGSATLKALSIRLITSLWTQQDRCFPHLQQVLLERDYGTPQSDTAGVNEVLLAKAASMRDICKLRPHQHGEDLIQPMSTILNECLAERDAPVVSLVLAGLYYLCEEEVIDIKTTWAVLSAKLKNDKRPLVVQGLCKLFSLVPALETGREDDFTSFKKEVVALLWNYVTQEGDALVVNAALAALSNFKPEDFHISYLPKKITAGLIEAALADYPEQFEVDENCLPAITGDCYTRLLRQLDQNYMTGFQKLLTSLVHSEVKAMPRGIRHSANRRQAASTNQNKALMTIPQYLYSEYGNNKQPGLRQGLAAGLLFGYDPSVQVGRDGKPRKQHLIQFGKQYYQMLYTLINEVCIQPTDWHRTLVTPQAWTAFMDRCYAAYIECRKAELELQLQQGQAPNPEENQLMQETAWLWARDKLTDLIKSCSKGSPTSQGNSLSALVGLAVASSKYFTSLSEEALACTKDTPEHLGQTHWLQMVANTLLAVMEFGYQPPGRIFAMCQQKTQADRTPASLLARSAAAASLSQILPILIPVNADLVYPILDLLSKRLPHTEQPGSEEDPGVIQWFYGLGLGAALATLFEEKFLEVSGVQGMLAVWKAVDALESSVFSSSDNRMGSVLGLGVCLSAMSKDGKPDTKVRVCRLQQQLSDSLQNIDKDNSIYEALCVSLACVTAAAYATNMLAQDVVDRTVAAIYTAHVNQPHIVGASVGLGVVCSGLLLAEHPTVTDLVEKLFYTWISSIQDTDDPMVQISAIQGAVAIAGPDNCIMQITSSGSSSKALQLGELVKSLTGVFHSGRDLGLQACIPWLLGNLYLSSCTLSTEAKSNVPSSYHYLPETSVLRACADLLLEAGKAGPELLSPVAVHTTLCSLNQGATQALPPLNWPAILSPIMRISAFGRDIEKECLLLAIRQSSSSPMTAMFLTTWLLTPLYQSLGTASQDLLMDSLPLLMKVVPPAKLEVYLKDAVISVFRSNIQTDESVREKALSGLCAALRVHDPPQSVTVILYSTLQSIYNCSVQLCGDGLIEGIGQCLKEIPDSEVDKITNASSENVASDLVTLHTRCYLVGQGCQPLTWLNQIIEVFMLAEESDKQLAGAVLCHCLIHTDQCQSKLCHVSPKMQWLLELLGYIKGLLRSAAPDQNTGSPKTVEFLLHVFGCAVVAWSPHSAKSLFAMKFFPTNPKYEVAETGMEHTKTHLSPAQLWLLVEQNLPACLSILLDTEPWKQLNMKIIDWLIDVIESTILKELPALRSNLKSCLYSLRHSKDFHKINTWSRAFSVAA